MQIVELGGIGVGPCEVLVQTGDSQFEEGSNWPCADILVLYYVSKPGPVQKPGATTVDAERAPKTARKIIIMRCENA